jgi:hypothetical protein
MTNVNDPTPPESLDRPGGYLTARPWMPRLIVIMAVILVLFAAAGIYLSNRPLPFRPAQWQTSLGSTRGRMLKSLLAQTDFVGFPRSEVEVYLGPPDFDERLLWYDLGPVGSELPVDPRAAVGDPTHLYGVFEVDPVGTIREVLYNHRRPTLGSRPYDSAAWSQADPAGRRAMFLSALGQLRSAGMQRATVLEYLGPPTGARVRSQYDVGRGGSFLGTQKALILEYSPGDTVIATHVSG